MEPRWYEICEILTFVLLNSGIGTFIAVAHHPATVTLHSVQDGAQHNIMFPRVRAGLPDKPNICSIWWFKRRELEKDKSIPDLLKRNDLIVCYPLPHYPSKRTKTDNQP